MRKFPFTNLNVDNIRHRWHAGSFCEVTSVLQIGKQAGVRRAPAKTLLCQRARSRIVACHERCEKAELFLRLRGSLTSHRHLQAATNHFRNLLEWNPFFSNTVIHPTSRPALQCQPKQTCRIVPVDGRPSVHAISDVSRYPLGTRSISIAVAIVLSAFNSTQRLPCSPVRPEAILNSAHRLHASPIQSPFDNRLDGQKRCLARTSAGCGHTAETGWTESAP